MLHHILNHILCSQKSHFFLAFHNWFVVMAECCSSCLFLLLFPVFFGEFSAVLLNKFFTSFSVFHVHWFLVFFIWLSICLSSSLFPSLLYSLCVLVFVVNCLKWLLNAKRLPACQPALPLSSSSPSLSLHAKYPPCCLRPLSLFDHLPLLDVHQFMLILSGKLYLHFNFMKE